MTALFEEGLYAFLTAIPAIKNLAQDRIYPVRAPDTAATPFIVYTKISGARDALHDGNPGFAHPRIQFSCWSNDSTEAKRLSLEVVKALHGFRGSMGQVAQVAALVDDEATRWDTESRLHHVAVDVHFWHSEET